MGGVVDYEAGQPETILLTFGDISVSQNLVYMPSGAHPIRGSVWTVMDMSRTEEKISQTGIVLAFLFVWACFLGLLFLLMKDYKTTGYIQVIVQGKGFHHSTMIPASDQNATAMAQHMVAYARTLAAAP
jgi:hypothetical protein